MGVFSSLIGDVPGDLSAIDHLAAQIHDQAEAVQILGDEFRTTIQKTTIWTGRSREAFEESANRQQCRFTHLYEGLEAAASDIAGYAREVASAKHYIHNRLLPRLVEMDRIYEAASKEERPVIYASFSHESESIAHDYYVRIESLKWAAEILSQALREALRLEPVSRNRSVAGTANDPSRTQRLDEADISRINTELSLLKSGNYNLHQVQQGTIGDCYFISAILALMNTPKGQEQLAKGVTQHFNSSGQVDGYMVRIYDNPLLPSPGSYSLVLVRETYANGANSGEGASIVSIYEKAYAQLTPGGVNESSFLNGEGITSNTNGQGLLRVTGRGSHLVNYQEASIKSIFGSGLNYDAQERQEVVEALQSGKPVTTATVYAPIFGNSNRIPATVMIDGNNETIQIFAHHSYMIKSANETSLTLVNPHGRNPGINHQRSILHGEFSMSWSEFEKYFGYITIGEIP